MFRIKSTNSKPLYSKSDAIPHPDISRSLTKYQFMGLDKIPEHLVQTGFLIACSCSKSSNKDVQDVT